MRAEGRAASRARALVSALAALVALVALRGAASAAGDHATELQKEQIEARAWCVWPDAVNKGWAPIGVEIRNRSDRTRRVVVDAQAWGYPTRCRARQEIDLAPGESASLELVSPVGSNNGSVSVTVSSGGERRTMGPILGGAGSFPQSQSVLAIGPRDTETSTVTRWTEEISTASLVYGGPGAATNNNLCFGHARFDELPSSPIAYSSLDLAVLDVSEGLPLPEDLDPLLAWVRTGGSLLVVGPDAGATCLAHASIAPWMEPRFARGRPFGGAQDREGRFCFGLGTLATLDDGDFLQGQRARELVRELAQADSGFAPDPGGSRTNPVQPLIADLGQIPYRVFALLLVLFALAIGPVNFLWVARARKPVRLLVTIPGIALATSLVLLVYGIFFQGLDVKTASVSVALLDQRSHRSSCAEKRLLFAGLAPSDGLRPEPGTAVHVVTDFGGAVPAVRHRDQYQLEVRREPELVLGADFLPTRVATAQVICTERAERARLDVARDGASYQVHNQLGVELRELVLRDPGGNAFVLGAPLSAAASATLVADERRGSELEGELLSGAMPLVVGVGKLPPGCYAARLDSSPFRDPCGIETNERSGDHRVLGVLAVDGETWQ